MTCDLSKIKLGYSPLSKQVYLYRHGKDSRLALDKRDAQADVMAAVVEYMMDDAPKRASQVVMFGKKRFEITVKPAEIKERE